LAEPVCDEPARLTESCAALLAQCDLLITTGGVSVGSRDYMPQVGERLGAEQLFYGVDMKPGSPMLAFLARGKLMLCLSGNPFASAATFELLARPALRGLAGDAAPVPARVSGVLREAFGKRSDTRRFIRARMAGGNIYLNPGSHASGGLASLTGCNCLVDIPAGSGPLCAGDTVQAVMF
jgi:molybdopterin molybdotransferase